MIKGFGLYNFSSERYNITSPTPNVIKESIEEILDKVGYEKGFPINFNQKEKESDMYGYESIGEGGCTVRYATSWNSESKSFYCCDKKGENHLVGAVLRFIGATGSLVQRTKKEFEKRDIAFFEL